MLQFLELRINPEKRCLTIDVEVEDLSYFKNVTIDSIYIDTQDTWTINGPSSEAKCVYSPENTTLDIIQDLQHKRVRVNVSSVTMPISSDTLYFVYVFADVSHAAELTSLPCTETADKIIGTVVDTRYLYDTLLSSLKEFRYKCADTSEFVDRFLRLQVVESSIRTGNYHLAVDYWKRFFKKKNINHTIKHCGCHGRVR